MRRHFLLLPALAFAACDSPSDTGEPVLVRAALAEARWEASRSWSYEIVQQRACECLPEMGGPVLIAVQYMATRPPGAGFEVVTISYAGTGAPVPEQYRSGFLTVRQLFQLIRSARAADAYRVEAEFDPARGYPQHVAIDYDAQLADDEVVYTISSYRDTGYSPLD